ncbi:Hypothetical protein CINCED_3A000494 [Cinara cedri]|uniref:Uncharacterized protein n=1 Tax=Cinara cedri TaxID=506608 RepID=A0A5E4MWB8_9HEMI|nr:Hypothetical protein CINCED_3A000494 [Cinara cedri]
MNTTKVIMSTPINSMATVLTVSHESNVNIKLEKPNIMPHEETSNDSCQLNDTISLNTNQTLAEKIDKNPGFMVLSLCLQNVTDLKNLNNLEEPDEDKMYGEYVTQRLSLIENKTVKQYIKLEIDKLFYSYKKNMSIEK